MSTYRVFEQVDAVKEQPSDGHPVLVFVLGEGFYYARCDWGGNWGGRNWWIWEGDSQSYGRRIIPTYWLRHVDAVRHNPVAALAAYKAEVKGLLPQIDRVIKTLEGSTIEQ